jgi:hypothetical protein
MVLHGERANAMVSEEHGRGQSDQAAAYNQNRDFVVGHDPFPFAPIPRMSATDPVKEEIARVRAG